MHVPFVKAEKKDVSVYFIFLKFNTTRVRCFRTRGMCGKASQVKEKIIV